MSGDDHIPESGVAVRQGFLWNLLNFAFSQGAGIVIFLLLSHQVSPAIFGVFAMAAILVDLFANQGRWAAMDALVQRQDFSPRTLSSAFFALMGVAIVLAITFAVGAGLVARGFSEPDLDKVLRAMSLTLLFMPPLAVMDALVMRRLQFRAQALRNMAGTLAGGAAGLWVAFGPAAEWALVAQRLVALAVAMIVLYGFTRWLPVFAFDKHAAKSLLARAGQLWASMLLATAPMRVLEASIGVRSGATSLGLLRVAQRFEEALHGPITGPIQALWVPILSRLKDDGEERRLLYRRLTQLAALAATPAFVGLGLVASDLVPLLLDPRYHQAGDILFIIGLTGFLIPLGFYTNLVFAGLDRSDLAMKFSLAAVSAQSVAVWFAAANGPVAAMSALVATGGIVSLLAARLQTHLLGARFRHHLRALAPAYIAAGVMAACVTGVAYAMPDADHLPRLLVKIAAGAAGYCAYLAAFHWRWLEEIAHFVLGLRGARGAPAAAPEMAE